MALPPAVDAKIRARFDTLIREAAALLAVYEGDDAASAAHYEQPRRTMHEIYDAQLFPSQSSPPAARAGTHTEFVTLRTRAVSLLELLSARPDDNPARLVKQLGTFPANAHGTQQMLGVLTGIYADYQDGMLDRITTMIEAEVTANYLGQAEALLEAKHKGVADRFPAAVLAGAVLENALRTLCQRQTPPISLSTPKGGHKMLNALIDELKAADLYNELQAKDLRVWADIRNAAAHGDFDNFDREQVQRMLTGISAFLTKHM